MCFKINDLKLISYNDADFRSTIDHKKSRSEQILLFGGIIVSWLSKKQSCVAKLTMEANYISCISTISNVVWMKRFIESLNLCLSTISKFSSN